MAPPRKKSKVERAKQYLRGGGVTRDDSDDELGDVDHPWEWIYASPEDGDGSGKEKIVGARMGNFSCRAGDTVLLKAEGNEAWVGLIADLFEEEPDDDEDEDGEGGGVKMANFMWFSTPKEIRNKAKKRNDALENEIYITPAWDNNPLTTINGKAIVLSPEEFARRYPAGAIPRTSKDYGKVFVCRRGCATRTATYTEEFVWENVYGGETDLSKLVHLVTSQTRVSRKRRARDDADGDDFAVDEEDTPKTPKKRRKRNEDGAASTPSKRSKLTPKKLVTPTAKRVIIKKPLEFTPLGTRVLPPSALSSPFQIARSQLHVATVPAALPCREEEFAEVYSVLEKAITDGTGSCIYIAGTPGTGKTATVREVVAQLNAAVAEEELDDFIFVEINGMKVVDPHQAYSLLWEALRGDRVSPAHALELLEREFSSPSPRRVPCVVLMDELDQLVTRNQSVMYNFFNWPGLRHARLIVLAVANTMDLPERTLSNKISSRLGLHRITFRGYTHDQLMHIIQSRLANVPGGIVHPDAVQFAARKVAAVSGDARRALDICRRAVEMAERDALDGNLSAAAVGIPTVKRAIAEATSSPLQQHVRGLPLTAKVFLAALLARARRSGVQEAAMGDVLDEARRLALACPRRDIAEHLLLLPPKRAGHQSHQHQQAAAAAATARVMGLGRAAAALAAAGLVGMEVRGGGERAGRVRLNVGEEEIRLALRDDDSVKGLGFG